MKSVPRIKTSSQLVSALLSIILALPLAAYDSPLSQNAIRDAYFLGSREGGLTPQFLKKYSRWDSDLHEGTCTTEVRLETPFLQVADSTSKIPNYSSQDAVKDFYNKHLNFRAFLNICYMSEAPPPGAVKIKFFQYQKEITPLLDTRTSYSEPVNETGFLPANGEKAAMEFDAKAIDSSTLTVVIDTPAGQHSECTFDLQSLR